MFRHLFGGFHTMKVRVPLPCCRWCEIQIDGLTKDREEMKLCIDELQEHLTYDRATALVQFKMEMALQLFDRATNAEAKRGYFVSDPVALTQILAATFEAVDSVLDKPQTWPIPKEVEEFRAAVDRAFVPMSSVKLDGNTPRNVSTDRKTRRVNGAPHLGRSSRSL